MYTHKKQLIHISLGNLTNLARERERESPRDVQHHHQHDNRVRTIRPGGAEKSHTSSRGLYLAHAFALKSVVCCLSHLSASPSSLMTLFQRDPSVASLKGSSFFLLSPLISPVSFRIGSSLFLCVCVSAG